MESRRFFLLAGWAKCIGAIRDYFVLFSSDGKHALQMAVLLWVQCSWERRILNSFHTILLDEKTFYLLNLPKTCNIFIWNSGNDSLVHWWLDMTPYSPAIEVMKAVAEQTAWPKNQPRLMLDMKFNGRPKPAETISRKIRFISSMLNGVQSWKRKEQNQYTAASDW